jgi:NAD(P)-dependent dehydrogenase (short-subunit alcohol dehydrogenase family)
VSLPDPSDRSIPELISLRGRGALVTGAAVGLGAAIARRLVEAEANVVITDIDGRGAEAQAAGLGDTFSTEVRATAMDVTDSASVAHGAQWAAAELGGIDIWVNNAGVYPSTAIVDMTEEQWDQVVGINLRGTFLGCREAARHMKEAGRGGVIVNMASIAGLGGRGPGVSHYAASKHGMVGLTKQLALELASDRIRVLAVAPTTILTPGVEAALAPRARAAGVEVRDVIAGPGGRAGLPDDVARVVLFCASDLAGFMTGSTLLVDGGEMAR